MTKPTNSSKATCIYCETTLKRENGYFTLHLTDPSPDSEAALNHDWGNDLTMCFECTCGYIRWLGPFTEAVGEALDQLVEDQEELTEPIPEEEVLKKANEIMESRNAGLSP